ncbi:MAG: hypothetical protein FH758_01315 [Firmicutes bacterium]|nr:hypothetical protein [Bacillota bacterium]
MLFYLFHGTFTDFKLNRQYTVTYIKGGGILASIRDVEKDLQSTKMSTLFHNMSTLLPNIGMLNQNLSSEERLLRDIVRVIPSINPNIPFDQLRFVILDTETTGLKPNKRDKIISFGAVLLESGKIKEKETFYELVNPKRSVPKIATDLTGITGQMLTNKPDLTDVLSRFIPWAGNSVLVGHAIGFDLDFINRHLRSVCGRKLGHKFLDTKTMASALFPDLSTYSLENICKYLNISCGKRHHALSDALSSARILSEILKYLTEQGIKTLHDLDNFLRYQRFLTQSENSIGC